MPAKGGQPRSKGDESQVEWMAQAYQVIKRLEDAGFEAFLVGGCVRDFWMQKTPQDIDITTSATPQQTKAVFAPHARAMETGIRHGTVTVVLEGVAYEITTYRIDGDYSDSRRPDSIHFTKNLTDDLARRDFTINAAAYHPVGGLIDRFGSERDIRDSIIRAVGDPDQRFREDALRILRGLRFASTLGFVIEPETLAAMERQKERLCQISAERISSELLRLLTGKDARRVIAAQTQIIGVVLPELLPMCGFDQKNPHHAYTVLEHCLRTMEQMPDDPILRLAGLLHDVGKPATFSIDEAGVGHFYGHAAAGERIADEMAHRLRLDNVSRERLCRLICWHDIPVVPQEKAIKRWLRRTGEAEFWEIMQLKRADRLAHGTGADDQLELINKAEQIARELLAEGACFQRKQLAVNGKDLLAQGMPEGLAVGQMLDELLDQVISGALANERDALLRYANSKDA